MEQNKVRSYTFYAIGEVLLVVVGILIALQVNNWSELRKQQELGKEYVVSLTKDLRLDIDHFDNQIRGLTTQLAAIDSIGNILQDPSTTLSDFNEIIKNNFDLLRFHEDSQINTSTVEALQNSGRTDLLNDDIQDGLIRLSLVQKRKLSYIDENLNFKTIAYEHLMSALPLTYKRDPFPLNETIDSALWNDINWEDARMSYYNSLYVSMSTGRSSLRHIKDLKEETNTLLMQLERQTSQFNIQK